MGARAHDGVAHGDAAEAAAHRAAANGAPLAPGAPQGGAPLVPGAPQGGAPLIPGAPQGGAQAPLPLDIRARFELVDHTGAPRASEDFAGRPFALFFGYASCESICGVAGPRLAEARAILAARGLDLPAVMVTVDPERDTPAAMAAGLAEWGEGLIGLTGDAAALARLRADFGVEAAPVAQDAAGAPIYAHGAFLYLVGPQGRVLTLLPPILSPERIAEVFAGYM